MNAQNIVTEFEIRGFNVENTGGNCLAFAKYFENGEYILCTTPDAHLPDEYSDALLLVRYDSEGDELDYLEFDSVSAFIASAGDWWDD